MANDKLDLDSVDWSLTTWEGSRREQLRQWSRLSLREIILAQQEMRELSERFGHASAPPGNKTG